jgi:hypothetical protein
MLYLYTCADLALSSNAVATLKMQYVFAVFRIKTSNRPRNVFDDDSTAVSITNTDMMLDTTPPNVMSC